MLGTKGGGQDRLHITDPNEWGYDFPGGCIKNPIGRTRRSIRLVSGQRVHFGITISQSLLCSTCTGSTGTSANQYVPTESLNENFNVYDGAIYVSQNPLLGCSAGISYTGEGGVGGNILTKFGDILIQQNRCDRSIIAPIGVNATSLQNWLRSKNVDQKEKPRIAFERAAAAGIPVTYVWISIGTTDSMLGIDQSTWTSWITELIGEIRLYYSGPIFVNQETWTGTTTSSAIRAAQAGIVNNSLGIHAGVDLDAYTVAGGNRQADDIHFNDVGSGYIAANMEMLMDWAPPYTVP